MTSLEDWLATFRRREAYTISGMLTVRGTVHRHLGPTLMKAAIVVTAVPADGFGVSTQACAVTDARLTELVGAAELGIADELLAGGLTPISCISVEIVEFETDEVSSSVLAFYLAGRDAAKQIHDHALPATPRFEP